MEMGEQLHSKHLIEHYIKLFTTLSEFKQNIRQISINVVYKNTNKFLPIDHGKWSIFFRSVEIKTKFMYLIGFITLTRPLRRKLRIRWVFDISKVKEPSFFLNRTLLAPPQIFDAHLLENFNLSPSSFHFPVGFYIKICFETDGFIAYSNE